MNVKLKRLLVVFSCLIFTFGILLSFFHALWNPFWTDGDEVHYLIMTESFLKDGDFNLENNYKNGDYLDHHGVILPNSHTISSPVDDSQRSWHGILLPILVSPGYFARELIGARLSLWFLNTILSIFIFHFALKHHSIQFIHQLWIYGLFMIQMPIVLFQQYIYTDLIAGYFWLSSIVCLLAYQNYKNKYWLIGSSIISGLGIFLHYKFILAGFLTLVFWMMTYFELYKMENLKKLFPTSQSSNFLKEFPLKEALILFLPFGMLLLLNSIVNFRWFGSLDPGFAFSTAFQNAGVAPYANPIRISLTMLIDGKRGLFVNAPLLYLAIPSLFFWCKYERKSFFAFCLPILVFFVFHSFFNIWFSWEPVSRFSMIMTPPLMIGVAIMLKKIISTLWGYFLIVITGILSFLLTLSMYFLRTGGYPSHEKTSLYWDWITGTIWGLPKISRLYLDFETPVFSDYVLGIGFISFLIFIGWVMLLGWEQKIGIIPYIQSNQE